MAGPRGESVVLVTRFEFAPSPPGLGTAPAIIPTADSAGNMEDDSECVGLAARGGQGQPGLGGGQARFQFVPNHERDLGRFIDAVPSQVPLW